VPLNNAATPCGAKTRSGTPCKNAAMDNGRCRMHGGATPRGFALPQTKTGRWSRDLPTRLADRFAESEHDPDLLSVRADIRLLDTLMKDDFDNLDTGESKEAWVKMRESVDKISDGITGKKDVDVQKGLRDLRDIIDGRVLHYASVEEIRSKLEQRRKLVETEQKITLASEQAISVEKAMMLVGAIAGILKTRIHDTSILTTIQQDISLLLNAPEAAR
jgi:hypothetical protein